MRSSFVKEGASIYYYVVEWDAKDLSWADFRGKVLGPTDPADAPKDSLRGGALAERMNWLGYKADRDNFGKALLNAGVRSKTIKDWTLDPVVSYGEKMNPTSKSIWDTLEDMDSPACVEKCAEVDAWR